MEWLYDFKIGIRSCGSGNSVLFCTDIWIGELSLARSFPNLFVVASNKQCIISSQYRIIQGLRVWDIKFNRRLNENQKVDLFNLINLLDSYPWKDKDEYIWRWDKSGIFSIKSFYKFMNHGGLICPFFKVIWDNITPFKVKVHAWLVINNYLLMGKKS